MPRRQPAADLANSWFDPVILRMLQQVVDDAWEELARSGSPAGKSGGRAVVSELMAHRVFSKASHGELDPDRLRECALSGFVDSLDE